MFARMFLKKALHEDLRSAMRKTQGSPILLRKEIVASLKDGARFAKQRVLRVAKIALVLK